LLQFAEKQSPRYLPGPMAKRGRKPGIPNRSTTALKNAMARRIAEMPRRPPGADSIERMRHNATLIDSIAGEEYQRRIRDRGENRDPKDVKLVAELAGRAVAAWDRVAQYEHAKLSSVTVKQAQIDPSKLKDNELDILISILESAPAIGSIEVGEGTTQH
jgi:hypothetical protein